MGLHNSFFEFSAHARNGKVIRFWNRSSFKALDPLQMQYVCIKAKKLGIWGTVSRGYLKQITMTTLGLVLVLLVQLAACGGRQFDVQRIRRVYPNV